MNERTEALAKQAAEYAIEFATQDQSLYLPKLMEKFAELIVRECIDIVSPYAIRMENFDGGHPIADLKKHFGVKE